MEITRDVLMQLSLEDILLLHDVVKVMLQEQEQNDGGNHDGESGFHV